MGFSGARNEKISSAGGSWDKRSDARSQAEPPSMSPWLSGDALKHLPQHKGCGVGANQSCAPTQGDLHKLEPSSPLQNPGSHSSSYNPSLHPYAAFQTQPENETLVSRLPRARAELLSTISFLSGSGLTGCFLLK